MKTLLHHKNFFHDFKEQWRTNHEWWSGLPEELGVDGYTSSSILESVSATSPSVFFLFTELLSSNGLARAKEAVSALNLREIPLVVITDLSKSKIFDPGPQNPNRSIFEESENEEFFSRFQDLVSHCRSINQRVAYQPHLNTGIQNFTDIENFLKRTQCGLAIDVGHLVFLKIFKLPDYLEELKPRLVALVLQDYTPCVWAHCRRLQESYLQSLESNLFHLPTNEGVKVDKLSFLFDSIEYLIIAGERKPDVMETVAALRGSLALLKSTPQFIQSSAA